MEAFRLKWVGRKQGLLNEVSDRWLKAAPGPAKKSVGQRFKVLKELVESLIESASGGGPKMQRSRPRPSTLRCRERGGYRRRASDHAHAE